MNSKVEYSRCRVLRLTAVLDGWTNSKKEVVVTEETAPRPVDQEDEELAKEAEDRLAEREVKRKRDEPP